MLAIGNAAPLKPEVKLARAISEFEAALPAADKVEFRNFKTQSPPGIQDVIKLTATIDHEDERKSRRRKPLGPKLTSLLQAAMQFSSAVDMAVGASQNVIASSVWGVLKMLLKVWA